MDLRYEVVQQFDKNGEPRGYLCDGVHYGSVTTALNILAKPALLRWAWNCAVEGAAEIPPMDRTYEEMQKAIIAAGFGYWQVSGEAKLRGRRMHDALQALLSTGEPPDLGAYPEDEQGFVQALASYWVEHRPAVIETELPVASKVYRYGGRIDLVRGEGPALVPYVVDFKSGKADEFGEPREPYIEAHMQVAGYELALEEITETMIGGAEIVSLCANGKYEVYPGCADPKGFPNVLACARYLAETRTATTAWRKAMKADDSGG